MGKPLNWMLSSTFAKTPTSRILRNRLAATTILAVVPFLGYGRQAYAECLETAPTSSIYECKDASGAQAITDDNAEVSTFPGFSVTTVAPVANGIAITGRGHIQFTDDNASSITNDYGGGLSVISGGDTPDGDDPDDYPDVRGAVTIITNGTITGNNGDGIYAYNAGSGDITITADGVVTGITDDPYDPDNPADPFIAADGIYARNDGRNLTITTGAQSDIFGTENGIDARNYWNGEDSGNLVITADGYVTGDENDGIHAYNDGIDLTITTGVQSVVRGGGHGIFAENQGDGNLTIEANGWVEGNAIASEDSPGGDGINAYNSEDGESLTITTGADSTIRGANDGIDAGNYGDGALTITAEGEVTGFDGDGISAFNADGSSEDSETGDFHALTITIGEGSVVSGSDDGIDARNLAFGDVDITVNGSVTGQGEDGSGVYVLNGHNFTTANVGDSNANSAPIVGSDTNITLGAAGLAQGEYAGIHARSLNGQNINITNDGLVRNLSGESSDRAIVTEGGATNIENNSNLIGTVTLDDYYFNDTLDNDGFWNTAGGVSDFGGGSEDTVNNTGILVAADDPTGPPEETSLSQLEFFNNNGGVISLVDGQEGDTLEMNGTGGTRYVGTGGGLAVDAALGPGGPDAGLSDELIINGTADGTTTVHVNVVAANGANIEGIPVVRIIGDKDAEDHFNLDGPVSGGFFTWDMRFDEANNWHELYTITTGDPNDPDNPGDPVLGVGTFEFPAGFAATQDIWLLTMGSLLQRQADLRSMFQGVSVTPVADYSEPVEPTPVATITPGFWYKAFGAYIDRDDEQDGFTLDRKQTLYGGMAGFDFGTEGVGDALLFGVFGGYIVSDLDFKATNTEWEYEGPTVGAYATYIDGGLYLDATVKADFLDIDIDPEDLALAADDSETDAVNLGARLDAGYKFGRTVFVEPQATLAVVHTEIDDVDIFGGTVEFDDDTSVRGRLGLRLGVDHTHADATVYTADVTASVWETFTDDPEVSIVDTGVPDFGVSGDSGSTYGDLSLGLSVANPDGWSSFVRGNYLFADDYEAFTGNAGVRFVW